MIKADLVRTVIDQVHIPQSKANEAVNAIFDAMRDALTRGQRIELRGFGVFLVKNRKRGIGRNPKTGAEVAIPPGKTIRFKPGKALKASQ
jgi:DNA-binding protein HU-beta